MKLVNRIKKSETCYLAATCSPQLQTHTLSIALLHAQPAPDTESQHKPRATSRNDQSGKCTPLDLSIHVFA